MNEDAVDDVEDAKANAPKEQGKIEMPEGNES
jgi:hypothetical protein